MEQQFDLAAFERFIYSEVRCIDERRWDDWLALFADDGDYWAPLSIEDKTPGQGLSILYEDKPKLELRCRRYLHPLIHAQNPPSRTSHIVSNIMLDSKNIEANEYHLHAQFSMQEYRNNNTVGWAGSLHYRLKGKPDNLKIQRKKVLLINADSQMETIQIPF
jgi:benzoate/toluate 1,2-dioxygenase beta subunit